MASVLRFLKAPLLVLMLTTQAGYGLVQVPQAGSIQVTGPPAPGLGAFDTFMTNLMAKWGVPGAALAVVKDGRLVLAHGYGMADVAANQPVQPDSLFRIASVSKPITSAAIFLLVQQGRLHLTDKAFAILSELRPPSGMSEDPRIQNITIQDLLWHAGGWSRETTFDPMFQPTTWQAADATGTPRPATCTIVIRYMLGQPLQFSPGTSYDYSNFGYCVLGRIIEKVTGMSYEQFVQQNVLAPFGIADMKTGHTLLSQRAQGEVRYYDTIDGNTTSVFLGGGSVTWPYGGYYLEAMDSHGGWIASPIDLMRFVVGLDGKASTILLNPVTMQQMLARPSFPYWAGSSYYYASGWLVRPVGQDANWWHTGLLAGTSSEVVRDNTGFGVDFAVVFNSSVTNSTAFQSEMDNGIQQVVSQTSQWPSQDLFGLYGQPITTTTSTTTSTTSTNLATSSASSTTSTTTATSTTASTTSSTPVASTSLTTTGTVGTSSTTTITSLPLVTTTAGHTSTTGFPITTSAQTASNVGSEILGYAFISGLVLLIVAGLVARSRRQRTRLTVHAIGRPAEAVASMSPTWQNPRCQTCGALTRPGDAFCVNCGETIRELSEACRNCGTPNPADADFCERCGQKIGA